MGEGQTGLGLAARVILDKNVEIRALAERTQQRLVATERFGCERPGLFAGKVSTERLALSYGYLRPDLKQMAVEYQKHIKLIDLPELSK